MRYKDLISGSFFLLMACFICLESLRIGIGSLRKVGTGFFSFLGGVVLLGFALALLLTNILRPQSEREDKSTQSFRWRNVILVAVAILAYGLVLESLGYLISTLILMMFLFRAIEPQPWWIVIFASVCSSGFSYLLFQVWLKVDLPKRDARDSSIRYGYACPSAKWFFSSLSAEQHVFVPAGNLFGNPCRCSSRARSSWSNGHAATCDLLY